MNISYLETRIFTTSQGTEPVMAMLMLHGISDISVDDPRDARELILRKDKNEWDYIEPSVIEGKDEAVITFYTEDTNEGRKILEKIKIDVMKLKSDEQYGQYGNDTDFGRMYLETEPLDDNWKELWKEGIHPFKITDNIVIKPSWEDYEMGINELVIEIDPGMAFGTGSHETTASCAGLLEQIVNEGDTVLDIGTGSGILSIIAALCGAAFVDAYDIDAVSVEVARNNSTKNNTDDRIKIIEADILNTDIKEKYNIIVSNLTSGLLIKIMPAVKSALKDNGKIILSGMLTEEKDKMKKYFTDIDLTVKKEIIDGEWYTILLA